MAEHRYFKVCPRGFANEVVYFRVPLARVAEVDREFATFDDEANGGFCGWTDDLRARADGVAVEWADRRYVGF